MGQSFSRRLAGRFEKGLQSYRSQMDQEARESLRRKNAAVKSGGPTDSTGFLRENAPSTPRELEQEAYLRQTKGSANQEMPEDLIKFLNDVGPLERKVDAEFTSPRLRKQLEEMQEDEQNKTQEAKSRRRQRSMPIAHLDGSEKDDNNLTPEMLTTRRTTNFSTQIFSDDDEEFGLTDQAVLRLLRGGNGNTPEDFLSKDDTMTEEEKAYYLNLLEQTLQTVQIPVLMKDTDKSYVGAWPDKVESLVQLKLTTLPESRVRFCIDDFDEEGEPLSRADDTHAS